MIIQRLMTGKIFVALLIIAVQASGDDHHGEMTTAQAWGYATLAGIGIFLIGLLSALLVIALSRCISASAFRILKNMLNAIGCGAVLGDAIAHLIPASFGDDSINSNFASLIFIVAIAGLLLIERFFASCGITHDCDKDLEEVSGQGENKENGNAASVMHLQDGVQNAETSGRKPQNTNKIAPETSEGNQPNDEGCCSSMKGKESQGYMIFVTEFIHLFLSGFGLGVAFASKDKDQFVPLLIAVYAHQIPCSIGCVGIFIKSKFSHCQTIVSNSLVNFTALVGVLIGMGAGSMSNVAVHYLYALIAANFIYIAANLWRKMIKHDSFCVNFFELLSFALGVGSMYLVTLAESGEHGHNH